MFCKQCGKPIEDGQELCADCMANSTNPNGGESNAQAETIINNNNSGNYNASSSNSKSKIAAGLFALFLGSFGVHNFYLGYTGKAIAQLLITLLTCGFGACVSGIWGFIEGILIFTGSIDKDANGVPLTD